LFSELFNVFSKRNQASQVASFMPLSKAFRNRIVMLLRDHFQDAFGDFLEQLHRSIAYLHGEFHFTKGREHSSAADELVEFLLSCKDEEFLDVIELIFKSNFSGITWPDNALIPSINEFFKVDNLPYYLTEYTVEEFETSFYGTSKTSIRIGEFPKVVRKGSEVIHQNAIEPALRLLNGKEFKQANSEFLKALEDHRKGDFRDCLTKCGSAFESVMKVLCSRKSITYKETDTASTLLKALLSAGNLDTYWEQPLIIIATLRNRLSSSHGAGFQQKNVPEHVANYVINATASAILLLNDEFS
jgi:hypothetical protein